MSEEIRTISEEIRTIAVPACILCGTQGAPLYSGLRDRLFGAPGTWNVRRCANGRCGLLWLDPMPSPEDVHKAYASYYTHEAERDRTSAIQRFFGAVKRGYVANRFGYRASAAERAPSTTISRNLLAPSPSLAIFLESSMQRSRSAA